jgi:hypothetical protein
MDRKCYNYVKAGIVLEGCNKPMQFLSMFVQVLTSSDLLSHLFIAMVQAECHGYVSALHNTLYNIKTFKNRNSPVRHVINTSDELECLHS